MTTPRIRVAIVFGGRSDEHAVSWMSARSVVAALDDQRFEPVGLLIDREGGWHRVPDLAGLLRAGPAADGSAGRIGPAVGGAAALAAPRDSALTGQTPGLGLDRSFDLDVVFPLVHGPNGEDGTLQGLLELCGLPYVGSGVLGSALGMDKIVQKDLLTRHGLPTVRYAAVQRRDWRADRQGTLDAVLAAVGLPCYVKPAHLGSSVGIGRATDRAELEAALDAAAGYGRRVVCEASVEDKREIECAVLGNESPVVSVPGEVLPQRAFYDYELKYQPGGAQLVVPAELSPAVAESVRNLALRAFALLDCAGLARVDFFVERSTDRVLLNEVNTIPGFTSTSMYPLLWEHSGLDYRSLITRLIELALERHGADS